MRLFPKITGVIDRFDRAAYMTMPFDLYLRPEFTLPAFLCSPVQVHVPGGELTVFVPGSQDTMKVVQEHG